MLSADSEIIWFGGEFIYGTLMRKRDPYNSLGKCITTQPDKFLRFFSFFSAVFKFGWKSQGETNWSVVWSQLIFNRWYVAGKMHR